MEQAILDHALAEAEAGDWAGVVKKLQALESVTLNPKHWTLGDISTYFGDRGLTIAAKIAGAVKTAAAAPIPEAPLYESIFVALSTSGIQLHTPARQAMIEALGQAFTKEEIDEVKSLGVTRTPLYPTVTEAEVQETYGNYTRNQRNSTFVASVWNPAYNTALAAFLDSGKEYTKADLLKAIDQFKAAVEAA